jgi:hypothetical protein
LLCGLVTSTSAAAAGLTGTFATPVGVVSVSEKDGLVTGKLIDKKNPCGLPQGHVILDGSRLDDSITGTLRACKTGDGCAGPLEGAVMLLITRNGSTLSGAVYFDAGNCKTPIDSSGVTFKKIVGKPKPSDTQAAKPKASARARAEALAREAQTILQSNEGNAEEARAKLSQAVAIDPTYSEGFVGLGVTYFVRDRYDEALEEYKRALEANPMNGDAYYNTACVYAVKGDVAQALRYLRIARLNGFVQIDTLNDPDLKNLAGNPEFEKLKRGEL